MGYVVVWLLLVTGWCCVCGAIAGSIASKRDASYGAYFALGFFFGVIGVIAAAFAGTGGRRPTTVINNYYAVNADGSHTLLPSHPASRAVAPTPGYSARAEAALRLQWGCTTLGCSGFHRPTREAFCGFCGTPTRALPAAAVGPRTRADLETRACGDESCAAVGERTSDLVCRACRRDTVLGWTAPPPRAAAGPAVTRFEPAVVAAPRGPSHLLTRRCTDPDCADAVQRTSDLVCRSCRRETALA